MLATVPADIRVYIHIAGAMALVALLILSIFAARNALERGDQPSTSFLARTMLLGVFPAYVVMRVGAQLLVSEEHLDKAKATWLDIGFIVSDAGGFLIVVMLILTGLAARKAKSGASVAGSGGLRATAVLVPLLVAAYLLAIFAMTTKPD